MASSFLKPCWSSNSNHRGETHSLESEEYIKKCNKLLKWKIPKIPTSKIYKTNPFTNFFSNDPSIITKQTNIPCTNGTQAFNLISQHPIMDGLKKRRFYTMFNMGMIQIGIKPMTTKIPSNASIILCVFDARTDAFEDSIVGLVETKLRDGPMMYFNVFPNITMSMFDPKMLESLSLIVIVQGFENVPKETRPIRLMWRSCYKLILGGSALSHHHHHHALLESPHGKTTFFQTGFENSNVDVLQKVSKWDDVLGKLLNLILLAEK